MVDPACGSGGMLEHSADFVRRHHHAPEREIGFHGLEEMADTLRLVRLNLAVHGLSGDLRQANTCCGDPHRLVAHTPPRTRLAHGQQLALDQAQHFGRRDVQVLCHLPRREQLGGLPASSLVHHGSSSSGSCKNAAMSRRPCSTRQTSMRSGSST